MSRYAKAVAAFLGSLATWGLAAGADNHYTQVELWGLVGVIAATYATYAVENKAPKGKPADPTQSEVGPF